MWRHAKLYMLEMIKRLINQGPLLLELTAGKFTVIYIYTWIDAKSMLYLVTLILSQRGIETCLFDIR